MNCKNCGSPLRPNAKFCGACGNPVENSDSVNQVVKQENYRPSNRENQEFAKQESYRPSSREKQELERQESYRPASREKQEPEKQGSYRPASRENQVSSENGSYKKASSQNNLSYDIDTSETKKVRKYFLSQSLLPTILIIVGIPLILFAGLGLLFIIAGIIMMFIPNFKGEDAVDRAMERQKRNLKKRGMEKLNLIQDQVNLIEPIVLVGVGISPDNSFSESREIVQRKKSKGFFGIFSFLNIFRLFSRKKSNGTENDPISALRIGSDDNLRTMLLEVSIYYFSEQQVLIYSGDVDISTGLVYHERTTECFYQDIEGMNFSQHLYKVFSPKKKKYVNKIMESFTLYLGGCNFSASMNSEINNSVIDNQFSAMRNLIRDKKNT